MLYLGIALVAIAAVCLAVHVGTRWAHRRRHSPGELFAGLCRIHNLDRDSRALLKRLAHYGKLDHPARLFIEPRWLDPATLPGPMRNQTRQVIALRDRLFRENAR